MQQRAQWSTVSFLFPPLFTFNFVKQPVKTGMTVIAVGSLLSHSLPFSLQIGNVAESTGDVAASERETAGSKGGQEGTESCDSSRLFQNCVLKWNFCSL